MPRSATATDEPEAKVHTATGFDKKKLSSYVKRVEKLQEEIDGIMSSASEEAQPQRDDIKALYKEAAEAGFPKRELKAVIRKRRLLAKAAAVEKALTEEQQETFGQMCFALDMPDGNGQAH